MNPIAIVGEFSAEERSLWLTHLQQALLTETIVPFAQLTAAQKNTVEIAIVANPSVEDVAQLPNLKWIQSLWAGVEKLLPLLQTTQLPLVRMVDPAMANAMAETALTWVLYLHKDMHRYQHQQKLKIWQPYVARASASCHVAVLGMGELGQAVAEQLQSFGFNVTGWSRSAKPELTVTNVHGEVALNALLGAADIVICLLPLTEQTRGLFDEHKLRQLKSTAALINFARGPIVVESALLKALDNQQLAHAVLDVFNTEPLPDTHPYWEHPNVTILPHISAQTNPVTASLIVAKNVRHYRRSGDIPNCVSYSRGY